MSQEQTPLQQKIEELTYEYSNVHYERGDIDEIGFAIALAQYIKEEIVPEESIVEYGTDELEQQYWDRGHNACRSKVVDKFKEMGI